VDFNHEVQNHSNLPILFTNHFLIYVTKLFIQISISLKFFEKYALNGALIMTSIQYNAKTKELLEHKNKNRNGITPK
jgi:hypothetical protein